MSSHKPQPQSLFDAADPRRRGASTPCASSIRARCAQESGDLRDRGRLGRRHDILRARSRRHRTGSRLFSGQIAAWLWFTVLFANFAEAVAEGRGKAQADALRKTRTDTTAKRLRRSRRSAADRTRSSTRSTSRSTTSCSSRPAKSSRATATSRRHRVGRRIGDHRRIRAGHPRSRRRPLGGHRRHDGALRPHQGADHRRARLDLHRPHDRARGRRRAPEDAERAGAVDPAVRPDDHLPDRLRDALADRRLFGDGTVGRPC